MPTPRTRWTIGEERDDGRWFAPSAERNGEPILAVLRRVLPPAGKVLVIGSGTGQHAAKFAAALPRLEWQPAEADPGFLRSIELWTRFSGATNILPPMTFDVQSQPWPITAADAIVCINVLHVAPWAVAGALFQGARLILPVRGPVILYGPYRRADRATAPSNDQFDAALRAHDARWGLRAMEDVSDVAAAAGFILDEITEMPANNLTLVFRHTHALSPPPS